jgi:hypothetical protein
VRAVPGDGRSQVRVSCPAAHVQALLIADGAHAWLASRAIICAQPSIDRNTQALLGRLSVAAQRRRLKLLLAQIERVVMTTP